METLAIIPGTLEDAADISSFQQAMAIESEGTVLEENIVLAAVSEALSDISKGRYFLAKNADGLTIGCLFLTKEWSDWHNCEYWWIQSVYVLPQYRNEGVFKTLYNHVRVMAKNQGVACLRLYVDEHNFRAQSCYRKLGMDQCHYLMFEEDLMA